MRTRARTSRAFVFLAALGVMAVTILLVFAMSAMTQFSYRAVGFSLVDVQERLMARSAADYAMVLMAQRKIAADGKPTSFTIVTDRLRGNAGVCQGLLTLTLPGPEVYQATGIAPIGGDVVVHAFSPTMIARYGRGQRWLLVNTTGKRARAIDVTTVFRRGLKQGAAKVG